MPDRHHLRGAGEAFWLDRLIAPLPRGAMILDVGCGGGEPVARHLIDRGFRITGIDRDAAMIELAHTRFPRERWITGDMRHIVLDEVFDGVIAWNSLSHLSREDQGAMAARAADWLKPGGRLLFNAERSDDATDSDYRPGSLYARDIGAADYSGAIARRGLIEMAHVESDPACRGAGVWLARKP